MQFTLDMLKIGQSAIVNAFKDAETGERLSEMGCTPGEKIKLSTIAPLGDPLAINISGYTLSLRRTEASAVFVTIVD